MQESAPFPLHASQEAREMGILHLICNQVVAGSNPIIGSIDIKAFSTSQRLKPFFISIQFTPLLTVLDAGIRSISAPFFFCNKTNKQYFLKINGAVFPLRFF